MLACLHACMLACMYVCMYTVCMSACKHVCTDVLAIACPCLSIGALNLKAQMNAASRTSKAPKSSSF